MKDTYTTTFGMVFRLPSKGLTRLFAVVLLLAAPFSLAQTAMPTTPAGKVLTAMLASFNSGDPA